MKKSNLFIPQNSDIAFNFLFNLLHTHAWDIILKLKTILINHIIYNNNIYHYKLFVLTLNFNENIKFNFIKNDIVHV